MNMKLPLCIDLDGTLIHTDVLQEMLSIYLKRWPYKLCIVMVWWFQGRAYLKQQLAHVIDLDPALLPYNHDLVQWLRQQKGEGYKLVLVTASDIKPAHYIADHIQIFDDVLASEGKINLRAEAKATALIQRYGRGNFIYAGNSRDDLKVWAHAMEIIVVNAPAYILKKVYQIKKPLKIFNNNINKFGFYKHLWLYISISVLLHTAALSLIGYLIF